MPFFLVKILSLAILPLLCFGGDFNKLLMPTLEKFFIATGGKNWVQGQGLVWDFSQNPPNSGNYTSLPCYTNPNKPQKWQGMYFKSGSCNLGYLALKNFNLVGSLPSSLAELTDLQVLDVSFNSLGGNFFSTKLPLSMTIIAANDNFFTGTIPSSWANSLISTSASATSLNTLIITDNSFSGSIPSTFGRLTALTDIELQNNMFTGAVMPSFLGSLKGLNTYIVSGNQFTAGPGLDAAIKAVPGALAKLARLDISVNHISTSFTQDFFPALVSLQDFRGGVNCFAGSIPSTICQASNLKTIVLDGLSAGESCVQELWSPQPNPLTLNGAVSKRFTEGSIPSCVFHIKNLTTLHLSGNSLTGS